MGRVCNECAGKSCGPKGIAHCDDQMREDRAREERRLKPCPFCGIEWDEDEENSPLYVGGVGAGNYPSYAVKCEECGAEGPHARLEYEARDKWNERGK